MATSAPEQQPQEYTYIKMGRGGAGNFHNKKDLESSAQHLTNPPDLESQPIQQTLKSVPLPSSPISPLSLTKTPSNTTSPTHIYARTGRGGAGNYLDTVGIAASSPSETPNAAVRRSAAPAISGRGGAGNWHAANAAQIEAARLKGEEEDKEARVIGEKIRIDVESGLSLPAPAVVARRGDRVGS